ncbi:MAG: MerR family transcriptional regulator [bacterium]
MDKTQAQKGMRMKELSRAAGVPKGTILFYVKEGLIPKPVKTHANMAYYNSTHLNAIRLVKELQVKRFLPLSVIKQVLRGRDLSVHEIKMLVEMDGRLFRNLKENPDVKPVTIGALAERTGASLSDIRDMERHQILAPARKGKRKLYDEDDIRLVECWVKMRKAGFTRELGFDAGMLAVHRDLLKLLVDEEAKLLASRVSGQVNVMDLNVPRMVEEGTQLLNTMMGLIHKRLIVETVERYTVEFREKLKEV